MSPSLAMLRALLDKAPLGGAVVEIMDRETDRPLSLDLAQGRKKHVFVLSAQDEPDYGQAHKPIAFVIIGLSQYHQTMRAIVELLPRLARGGVMVFPNFSYYKGSAQAIKEHFAGGLTCMNDGGAYIIH